MPSRVAASAVAVEDRRFYAHHGVDPQSVARVVWAGLRGRGWQDQGGSTITQQLAKRLYTGDRGGLWATLEQVGLAIKLEWRYPKAQILRMSPAARAGPAGRHRDAAPGAGGCRQPPAGRRSGSARIHDSAGWIGGGQARLVEAPACPGRRPDSRSSVSSDWPSRPPRELRQPASHRSLMRGRVGSGRTSSGTTRQANGCSGHAPRSLPSLRCASCWQAAPAPPAATPSRPPTQASPARRPLQPAWRPSQAPAGSAGAWPSPPRRGRTSSGSGWRTTTTPTWSATRKRPTRTTR